MSNDRRSKKPRDPEIAGDSQPGGYVFRRRKAALARVDPASLRFFIAAIEEGTIASGAHREHVVPTAVSKRITRLEEPSTPNS